ncbi:MAG: molybdate ABC transporter permease subunit [Bacillota bacterium]
MVSAAASMTDALQEAQRAFEAQEQAVRIRFTFGSSGALARQIEQGAPVALFISAAARPMDDLVARGLVEREAVEPLAGNTVVLIRNRTTGSPVQSWDSLAQAKRIALGNPQHVPAGQYGQVVLTALGHWEALQPRLVLAEDVRQVIQYVAAGEVDGGIVYGTDAATAPEVEVVAPAPPGSHPPVVYPMAVLKDAPQAAQAGRFAAFLRSDQGREILARHGFQPAELQAVQTGGVTMDPLWLNLWISLKISLIATALVFGGGLPVAWALSRPGWRGHGLLDIAVNLPLALPPTVVGYYLLLLIGREGPVGEVTRRLWGSTLIFTPTAAVLASALVCLPLFVQAARGALESVPHEVYEAGQIDGCDRWAAFRYLFLPLAWPGVWTGVLLAFARSLGEFGATLMVAGNIPGRTQTVALAIYSAVQSGQQATAHLLALLLTLLAALAMWAGIRLRTAPTTGRTASFREGSA